MAASPAPRPGADAPTVVSVNVGMPKEVPWEGRIVFTGAWKHPVRGPRRVRRLNLDGPGATAGRVTGDALRSLGVPAGTAAYICGPAAFMTDMRAALEALGVTAERIHTELFGAPPSINPGLTDRPRSSRTRRGGRRGRDRWSPSPAAACRCPSTAARPACSNWPTSATSRPGGRAGPASAIPARRSCWPGASATLPILSRPLRRVAPHLLLPPDRRRRPRHVSARGIERPAAPGPAVRVTSRQPK